MKINVKATWVQVLSALLLAPLCLSAPPAFAEDAPAAATSAAGEAIQLQSVLAPAAGVAAFYITEETVQAVTRISGIFSGFTSGEEVYALHSARVHYTVLSAEDGGVRLLVRAQPVDSETGLPIAPVRWEATYLVAPDGPVLESGDEIPGTYGDIITPYWLVDWSAVAPGELPTGPLLPGAAWGGPASFDWGELGVEGLDAPITATFTGWVDAAGFGPAAHVNEALEASASALLPFFGDVFANQDIAIELSADHWFLPEDFPYGTEKWFVMNAVTSVGPYTGAPEGVEGEIHVVLEVSQRIRRDPSNELWLPYEEKTAIEPGETVSGVLGPWSDTFEDGTYVKAYAFSGKEGDVIDIYLGSPDFDAFLMVRDEAGNVLAHDDDSAGGTDAYLNFELPYTGVFYILANTYQRSAEGLYTLTVLPAED